MRQSSAVAARSVCHQRVNRTLFEKSALTVLSSCENGKTLAHTQAKFCAVHVVKIANSLAVQHCPACLRSSPCSLRFSCSGAGGVFIRSMPQPLCEMPTGTAPRRKPRSCHGEAHERRGGGTRQGGRGRQCGRPRQERSGQLSSEAPEAARGAGDI